jgi:hypothetical protein
MASQASSTVSTPAAAPAAVAAAISLPAQQTLVQAAKLAMEQDRAIMLDYYTDTAQGRAFLGEDGNTKERVLIKSKEEFTSLIKKLYKVGDDFIILSTSANANFFASLKQSVLSIYLSSKSIALSCGSICYLFWVKYSLSISSSE